MNDSPLHSTVDEALEAYRQGRMVIIVDDEDRENEGDLVLAADHVTPAAINFMVTHARGLVCLAMRGELLDRLQIPMMVPQAQNRSGFGTGFTLSVEAMNGVSTGISAEDRAHTIRTMISPDTTPADIAMPGHIFPLRARDGGVLERRGQTEASVDLSALAGLTPAGIICEVMGEDGTMMRLDELRQFAVVHDLHILSVEQLVQYRLASGQGNSAVPIARLADTENQTARVSEIGRSHLPTVHGDFDIVVFRDQQGLEHSALINGDIGTPVSKHSDAGNTGADNTHSNDSRHNESAVKTSDDKTKTAPLVRLHSECLTGDGFGSLRCDCGAQLAAAMQRIAETAGGIVLYLRQEGRGIGLGNKIRAYALQDQGLDTVDANHQLGFPADARSYDVAAEILHQLGVDRVRLLTNNPDKHHALESLGICVAERVPLAVGIQKHNEDYLQTKARKMGHQYLQHQE